MASEKLRGQTIAVLPGTGTIGKLLVQRLAEARISVVLGSRDAAKARDAAAAASAAFKASIKGFSNEEAAAAGDIIFWTPAGSLADREALLKAIAKQVEGKVIIDTTNIEYFIEESQWGQVSSTLLSQEWLGVPAKWTTAFKNTFAELIANPPDVNAPNTVLVAGDDDEAVDITIAIVDIFPGFKGIKAGPLKYTKIVELLGPRWMRVLDTLNIGENVHRLGYRIG